VTASDREPSARASEAQTEQIPAVAAPAADGAATPAPAAIVPVGGLRSAPPALDGSMAELRQRRYELAERVAELTWDLGGLTYEMAIRDHYRLDVLARRAAELQQADAQLAEVQRLLSSAEAGVHGQCRSCGAVHSRGASFCWHCGAGLLAEARPSVLQDAAAPASTA
jgi:chorismate mutase